MTTIAAQMLTIAVAILQRQQLHNSIVELNDWLDEYDYIVVGAGSAGSIVASRLSENPRTNVLLLEAGGPANFLADIPAAMPFNWAGNQWGYVTEPQFKSQQMFLQARGPITTGKVIGGSGMINGMILNRGSRYDFDNWAQKYGATEWSYEKLLPYFRRWETLHNVSHPQFHNSRSFHGTDGPLDVSLPQNVDPIHNYFIRAWNAAGTPLGDLNGPSQLVTGNIAQTIDPKHWRRASSAHGYLYPYRNRTNLHIIAHAHVTKVIINNRQACGVEFIRNGRRHEVRAKAEVILSAGAINTPQILMLSGIGPKKELERHNISVIMDLPVGQRFQDHVFVAVPFLAKDQSLIQWSRDPQNVLNSAGNLYDYYIHNTGPLTQMPVTGAFYSTVDNENSRWPNAIFFMSPSQVTQQIADAAYTNNPTAWQNYFRPVLNDDRYFEILSGVYRCHSRGSVRLSSKDPLLPPLIDPNFYDDERDENAQVDAVQKLYDVLSNSVFSNVATPYDRPIPGCESQYRCCLGKHIKHCREYLKCYIRYRSQSSYHPVGTVPMGKHKYAVVDNKLRVLKIRSLRVIDSSVMPEIPNGNTNGATMAIAEKGSDIIRGRVTQ